MSLSIGNRIDETKSNEVYAARGPQGFREHVEEVVKEIPPLVFTIQKINDYLDRVEEEEENEFLEPLRRDHRALFPLGLDHQPLLVSQTLTETTKHIAKDLNEYRSVRTNPIDIESLQLFDTSLAQSYQAFQNMLLFRKTLMLNHLKNWLVTKYIPCEEGFRDSIQKSEKAILAAANRAVGETAVFTRLPVEFSRFRFSTKDRQENQRQMDYMTARLVNSLFHQVGYFNQVRQFLHKHCATIFGLFKKSLIENPNFKLEFLGDETHNRGKKPILVTFMQGNQEAFKMVYKHRDGKVDKLVLELFKAINELPENQKSMRYSLPFYQIEPVDVTSDQSGEEPRSLHEFIKGKEIALAVSITCDELQDETAKGNLLRLEQISRAIGLTDLHRENVILKGNEWVPIDLEVIQEGAEATGLYEGKPPTFDKLTGQEQALVEQFKAFTKSLSIRFVPLDTANLISNSVSYEGHKETTKNLFEYLEKSPLKPSLDAGSVDALIQEDHRNGDVPIFINNGGAIYLSGSKVAEPV